MTRDEILEYFKDINHAYNDCTRYDTLKSMIEELQEPCGDAISRQAVAEVLLKYAHSAEGKAFAEFLISQINNLPPVTPAERMKADDAINRQAVLDMLEDINAETEGVGFYYKHYVEYIKNLPPVTPQYTDAEIQKMQDLEFAEIQKAYEIGKAEGSEVLDKIRAEIDEQYDRVHPYNISCAEGLEMALDIIDKYKASPTGAERSDKE